MTDRELLELAAKAAGLEIEPCTCSDRKWPFKFKAGHGFGHWNPLIHDGDALRLAVKLRLVIHVWDDGEDVSVAKTEPNGKDPATNSSAWFAEESHSNNDDLNAATRRAIVRAAAEIGKNISNS